MHRYATYMIDCTHHMFKATPASIQNAIQAADDFDAHGSDRRENAMPATDTTIHPVARSKNHHGWARPRCP